MVNVPLNENKVFTVIIFSICPPYLYLFLTHSITFPVEIFEHCLMNLGFDPDHPRLSLYT